MLVKLVTYEVEEEGRKKVEQPKQSVSGTFLGWSFGNDSMG